MSSFLRLSVSWFDGHCELQKYKVSGIGPLINIEMRLGSFISNSATLPTVHGFFFYSRASETLDIRGGSRSRDSLGGSKNLSGIIENNSSLGDTIGKGTFFQKLRISIQGSRILGRLFLFFSPFFFRGRIAFSFADTSLIMASPLSC